MTREEISGDRFVLGFRIFKRKVLIHRDKAAPIFIEHCHQEAAKLLASITPPLRVLCDGKDGRPTFDDVMARPFLSFDGRQFKDRAAERALIASHCYAVTTAIGLDSLHRHINPSSQADVMEWMSYRLIVEEDVGRENVGTPRSPRLHPKNATSDDALSIHVQWAPGTFEKGIPSQQKQLTDRYRRLSALQLVTILLMALKVSQPRHGVGKALYRKTDFGGGLVSLDRIGWARPFPDSLDEWEDDLQVTNAGDALNDLSVEAVNSMISAIETVNPFWPTFGKSHHVTWK